MDTEKQRHTCTWRYQTQIWRPICRTARAGRAELDVMSALHVLAFEVYMVSMQEERREAGLKSQGKSFMLLQNLEREWEMMSQAES